MVDAATVGILQIQVLSVNHKFYGIRVDGIKLLNIGTWYIKPF